MKDFWKLTMLDNNKISIVTRGNFGFKLLIH